jgi:acyl carrier protein
MEIDTPYREIEKALDIPANSLTGNEMLQDIPEWDSIATISFIAMADSIFKVEVPPKILENCITVQDLVNLLSEGDDS